MKKISGIFLLLCLTVPFLGTYAWLKYQHKQVRREVRRRMVDGMNKDELVQLEFTKHEADRVLHWKHSKEFEYNGKMYDVVERQERGDSVLFRCWADHKETTLDRQIDHLVASVMGHLPQSRENQSRLTTFLENLYHANASGLKALLQPENEIHLSAYHFSYSFIYHSPPAPPPEAA